ncbi:MAG: nucleotidyltransferase domain-containing protein [Nanoarchaeota archaeon]|nr:nucleotidyltransferase domain-containing protein [Nanoarchaeota archaeon]MBU1321146.1 nucleotidyltransferase domain-containing protein [Nanoarchaeota archaeon]MBU1597900.1 nucleotidyltransferase domain-containing protein [Nanoarchaeota archaeon]
MLRDLNKSFHASEIAKTLKLNQKSVSNHLNALEKQHLLKYDIKGRNKLFFFHKGNEFVFQKFILNLETSKTLSFLQSDFKTKEIMMKLEKILNNPFLVFGSYAKGLQIKESDLDLLTVGSYDEKEVKKIERFYSIEINIHSLKKKDLFYALEKKDRLMNEIVKDHIIICGFDLFINAFLSKHYQFCL